MADRLQYYIDKFRGGMATTYSNDNLGPTSDNPLEEFPIIDNFDFTERGAFEKRPGTTEQLMSNQDLLDLGLIQTVIDDNSFDETKYDGTFDAYFKYEAKGFYEQSDGTYNQPEPDDTAYDIRLGMMDGNLVVLNYISTLEDTVAKYTVFPTRVILSGLNSGVNMETVQFGNELYIATGDGYYVLRLIRRYSSSPAYDDYELEARRMDSTDELYYPDVNEIYNFGTNVFDDFTYFPYTLNLGQLADALTNLRNFPYTVSTGQEIQTNIEVDLTDVNLVDAQANKSFTITNLDPDGAVINTYTRYVMDAGPIFFTPTIVGVNVIKVELIDRGTSNVLDTLEIKVTVYDGLNFIPAENINEEINNCTRLFLYYNRIIMYNNGTGKWYKSDINRPSYFTAFCETDFAAINPESTVEILQSVTPYRNSLIVLTKKSMFLTSGKGDDFEDTRGIFEPFESTRVSDKGTLAPYSIAKNENNLIFLSNDGIYVLDAIYVDEKKANLYKISDMIDNLVLGNEEDASAIVFNNKYYINFPSGNYTLKWDYIFGQKVEGRSIPERLWSRDISTELIFKNMKIIDEDLYFIVEADVLNAKLLRLNRKEHLTTPDEITDLEDNIYPTGYFTDDGTSFQSLLETKAYNFQDGSRLKKVKQIILELSFGNYTLIYSANENNIIDAQQVPTIIFTILDGRVVSYSGLLENNVEVAGSFILGDEDSGVLGVNILGGIEEQYVYYTLRKSKYTQKHKIVLAHSEDAYAKILGFGFIYVYGKKPRNRNNSL